MNRSLTMALILGASVASPTIIRAQPAPTPTPAPPRPSTVDDEGAPAPQIRDNDDREAKIAAAYKFLDAQWTLLEETKAEAEDQGNETFKAADQAVATQTQVPTFRGGTLGVPAPALSSGLQVVAAAETDINGDTPRDFDLFTKLGGLSIRNIDLDILAEKYRQDVPVIDLDAAQVSPRFDLTDFTAIGFRIRHRFERSWSMVRKDARKLAQDTPTLTADARTEETATKLFDGRTGLTVSGGLRMFKRSSDAADLDTFGGIGGELAVQYSHVREDGKRPCLSPDRVKATTPKDQAAAMCSDGKGYGGTLFASVSATHLNGSVRTTDEQMTASPAFTEYRVTIGGELQTPTAVNGAALLPRLGAYATFSRASWMNRHTGADDEGNTDYQLEAALYASGHFVGGFNGLVSFGVIRPYGDDSQWIYAINVAPAIGAKLGVN